MDLKSAASLGEFFREAVSKAIKSQGVDTSELTEFYLVNLLSEFAKGPLPDDPLAIKMCEGLQATPASRAQKLREVGDTSLFVSGFFPDSLNRSLIDVDYYIGMGEVAYGHLSRMSRGTDSFTQVFCELSDKFTRFVSVFAEIATANDATGSSVNVLRLYEKYLKTGSDAVLEKLRRHGFPVQKGTLH
jgi:hypothetical protein